MQIENHPVNSGKMPSEEKKALIGTAGWNIPKTESLFFPVEGSHLERYSSTLNCVEINSSFYRNHLPKTYNRWANTVPDHFLFSVKLLQRFTHEQRLAADPAQLEATLTGILGLGSKLGVILVQLPPSLTFDSPTAGHFFTKVRKHYEGPLVLEPRHFTWTSEQAKKLLKAFMVTKARADPEPCPVSTPEAWESGLSYFRLHGSPEIYRSKYGHGFLQSLQIMLEGRAAPAWCVFDNTTFGHAWANAVELKKRLEEKRGAAQSTPMAG
ncbi:MAG: DUF72 domain-containing protein [Bacteriovoracia bacterium]